MSRRPIEERPHAIDAGGQSRTKQGFAEESEINNIMARYEKTGLLEHVNSFKGDYGDYTNVPQSFDQALNQVKEAQEMFMTLPASIRERYDNDPGRFLTFVDGATREELQEAGLIAPEDRRDPNAPPEPPRAAEAENPPEAASEAD